MTHNPSVFSTPDAFIPERHLDENGNFESINSILAYGFGRRYILVSFVLIFIPCTDILRRICVGRYMANDTIWLAIASVLATMKISSLPNESVEDYFIDGNPW